MTNELRIGPYTIVIIRRADDWRAHLKGDQHTWESGTTEAATVGRLVITLAERAETAAHDSAETHEERE